MPTIWKWNGGLLFNWKFIQILIDFGELIDTRQLRDKEFVSTL